MSRNPEDFEPIDVGEIRVLNKTDKALLVSALAGRPERVWIPVSQISDESEIDGGSDKEDEGTLVIPRWLAEEKGFE